MPRLGNVGESGGSPRSPLRSAAFAYPGPGRGSPLYTMIMLIFFTFILRNVFFNDYRTEEREQLEASGKTKEEIAKYVPESATEKRKSLRDERDKQTTLADDVKLLKEEMVELQKEVFGIRKDTANDQNNKGKLSEDTAKEAETTERRAKKVNTHDRISSHHHHNQFNHTTTPI